MVSDRDLLLMREDEFQGFQKKKKDTVRELKRRSRQREETIKRLKRIGKGTGRRLGKALQRVLARGRKRGGKIPKSGQRIGLRGKTRRTFDPVAINTNLFFNPKEETEEKQTSFLGKGGLI